MNEWLWKKWESNESDLLSLVRFARISHFPCEGGKETVERSFPPSGHKEWSFSQQAYLFLLTLSLFFFCYCQSLSSFLSLFAMSLSLDRRYTDNTGIKREEIERPNKKQLDGRRGRLNRRLSNDLTRFAGSLSLSFTHNSPQRNSTKIEGVDQGRESKWNEATERVCESVREEGHTHSCWVLEFSSNSLSLSSLYHLLVWVWMWMSVDG